MVGRASVTRELGSPALPDLTSHSRRSSSRASRRTAPTPEVNTSNLPQSSYSLPPTPLTSSFDGFPPSSKRRRTQRVEDKTFTPKGSLESPYHRAFSEPSQSLKSAKPIRNSSLIPSSSQSSQVPDSEEAGTASSSQSNPPTPSEQPQAEQIILSRKTPRNKTITVKPESTESSKNATDSLATMGSAVSHPSNTRKSMSTRLDGARHGNNTPSKPLTLNTSAPQSSRRDRKSRLAANSRAKTTKPPPAAKTQTTSPTPGPKPQGNGVNKLTSPKQHESQTLTISTRSRRGDRKSTKANEEAPSENKGAESATPHVNDDEHVRSHQTRLSNTVTLNVGRKPLESILAQQSKQNSRDEIVTGEETPGEVESDYHVEYDSKMYKNNFGLDGQMDGPTSPGSMSTTTSTAARTSGRTRKPTIRALESFESEQRYRRPRAHSAKPSAPADAAANAKTRSKQKSSPQSPTSTSPPANPPDIDNIAKRLYELAAAAVTPDFVPAPEVDTWLKELQQKIDEKHKEKDNEKKAESPQSAPGETDDAGESMPPPSKPFSDSLQASEPRTDEDGWVHTGKVNKHGEEYVIVPDNFEWYRPNYTYGDKNLPPPPVRLRTFAQAENDRVFGYPPCIGERNVPADNQPYFLLENVPEEKAKLELKEAARARGIYITRFMPREELEMLIYIHDNGVPPPPASTTVPENDIANKAIAPSRKRRRADTTSTSKLPEPTETPKSKRRRQEAENPTPPENGGPDPNSGEPESPEKKSLKITLTFGDKRFLLGEAAPTDSTTPDQSKKRPHSEVEDNTPEETHGHDTRSPKTRKVSTTTADEKPPQSMPAPSTPGPKSAGEKKATPSSSEHFSTETTSGGRPRRRASAALMAEFQTHAEDRARRSERARLAHARRKGTPLKNVTSLNDSPVDTPIRPAVNPMTVD
ncbi:putative GPI-anchored cell surface glycoprotein [Aspergillus lucknowensis]|uniref:GPI-anchored cell surface glycoprotein n=1 Tax=Aspergillus lucknowensis TaxID=176173 RepID=A0ABR4M0C8_9EURO